MTRSVPAEALDGLSSALWEERRLLDELRFRLEEERLVAAGNGHEWLASAHHQVEAAARQLQVAELLRAVWAEHVAAAAGLDSMPTLRQLAASFPEPWDLVLEGHLVALTAAAAAVRGAEARNRLLRDGPERGGHAATTGQPRSLVDFLG